MDPNALREASLVPDANGSIDISNSAWVNLDEEIWTHRTSLLILNVSNNSLERLSSGVGNLQMLRELNLSRNRLRELPEDLGKCSQLKILNVSENLLKHLPTELQWCTNLIEIHAASNKLVGLPREFRKLAELKILNVEHNELEDLPDTLCECGKLEQLKCEGNDGLVQIPKELRGNTQLVLWICSKTKQHNDAVDELVEINTTLEDMARLADEEKLRLKDEILRLEDIRRDLERERPIYYLKLKRAIKKCTIS